MVAILVVTTAGLAVASSGLQSAASGSTHTVVIKDFSFQPDTITIKPGDTVTWVNQETDGTVHTVTGDPLNSPDIAPGGTYSFTFSSVGSVDYHCSHHTYMTGTVNVSNGSSSSPKPKGSAKPTPAKTTAAKASAPQGIDLHDGTRLAPFSVDADGTKVFNLTMAPMKWTVSKGVVKTAYAFNGMVPGPTIRLNEGDRVRIIVKNNLTEDTGVHWHGMELPNNEDGVPGMTQPPIKPKHSYTYQWTAIATGTHWYHSHMGGGQIGRGLFGALEVVPKGGDIPADHDYTEEIGDGLLGFTINGRSFPSTIPMQAKVGERVHIRLIGTGPEMIHPIHLHGQPFQVVAQDGIMLPAPYYADTLLVGVGQTFDLIVVPVAPGHWMFHCHIFSHSEGPHGMMGLVTTLEVAPATASSAPSPSPAPAAGLLPSIPGLPAITGLPTVVMTHAP
jgi:FtsP/CotA-like multicopper oxidase with cupredoxin domain